MRDYFVKQKESLKFILAIFSVIAVTVFSFMFFSPVIKAF
jgi:hypothetical protein